MKRVSRLQLTGTAALCLVFAASVAFAQERGAGRRDGSQSHSSSAGSRGPSRSAAPRSESRPDSRSSRGPGSSDFNRGSRSNNNPQYRFDSRAFGGGTRSSGETRGWSGSRNQDFGGNRSFGGSPRGSSGSTNFFQGRRGGDRGPDRGPSRPDNGDSRPEPARREPSNSDSGRRGGDRTPDNSPSPSGPSDGGNRTEDRPRPNNRGEGVTVSGGNNGGGGYGGGGGGVRVVHEVREPGNRGTSRSGMVRYGTISNSVSRSDAVIIHRAPTDLAGILNRKVNTFDHARRVGTYYDGIRIGYYHYDRRWRDDYWCYPFYVFDPFTSPRCVISPWYYYPALPPYISTTRIVYVNNSYPYWAGDYYEWHRPDGYYNRGSSSDLDYAVDDIESAYEDGSRRSIEHLVPNNGYVAMYVDGRYQYSVSSDDFYDTIRDSIDSTRTTRYEILEVRTHGRDEARVWARHEFLDPWGRPQTVYHRFTLALEAGNFVIREFGTSPYRW